MISINRHPSACFFVFFLLLALTFGIRADNVISLVPQTWQMLDYLGTDYAGAVDKGTVINDPEFAEMREFSAAVRTQIAALPEHTDKASLLTQADSLTTLVENKADAVEVALQAHQLADALLTAYPIPTSPATAPDLARGATLYQSHCASCHGVKGDGDGPAAVGLDPPVIAFTDVERADQRSPLSLFQTISQGVGGTSMISYSEQLSEVDRWALAYYAGTLAYTDDIKRGQALWQRDIGARAHISNLDELSRTRADQISAVLGKDQAHALIGYLRAQPDALEQALTGIALARGRMAASVDAYRAGNSKEAIQLARSAYLDGIEPVELQLSATDSALRARIELGMGTFRSGLSKDIGIDSIAKQAAELDELLVSAQKLTSSAGNATTTFFGAFTILVREGLEALLIIVALLAFLDKAGKRETLRYVHAGWIAALVAGGGTWAVAHYLIDISGASRELTEGLSALFAALILLAVGLWMHQKSTGDRWQAYLKEKMSNALNKKSAWFLFALTFISVYREVFETILFYATLWQEDQKIWLLGGIGAAVLVLALIAWGLLRTSRRLPISTFFAASSVLIAVLAVALTGKGVSALQKAGWIEVSLAPVPHIDLLGVFPTWQTSLSQLAVIALLVIGYFYNKRKATLA
ncbi:high-affinity iron transporter [Nitrosomonas eutropha]|uniref:FTR1 family protein n=1 Tax=Nitrosomonas eutropha TaxID=916 RepID=UPI00087E78E5|nr:FTR1 family protein [Nitrosomonas eutropha]SCX10548.1 high-affinity iron transporter [Nitrosomonas eutropha]